MDTTVDSRGIVGLHSYSFVWSRLQYDLYVFVTLTHIEFDSAHTNCRCRVR